MLAIGRGPDGQAELLLLDEPSMGLSPILVDEIFDIIRRSTSPGLPSCWWSRTPTWRCRSPHRAYVLETGRIVFPGRLRAAG